MRGLVPATSPIKSLHKGTGQWSQGLVPRTVHTKHFEKQVEGTCPKNSNWFEFGGAFHYARDSGNSGRNSNGKVCFGFF